MALVLTMEQKQVVSLSMQQSLQVLSMPEQTLEAHIRELSMENPFIELADRSEMLLPAATVEWERDLTGIDFQPWRASRAASDRDGAEEMPDIHTVAETTFTEHLHNQLNEDVRIPAQYRSICAFIVESLNQRGYLEDPIEELADLMGVSIDDAMQALYIVQSLSPTGVGARNLQECLILQLAEGKDFNEFTLAIVKWCLPLLGKGAVRAIAKELGCTPAQAEQYCDAIRRLNPIPSRGFHSANTNNRYIVPDAVIVEADGKMIIKYSDTVLSRFRINQEYCSMAQQYKDTEAAAYLRKNLRQAKKVEQDLRARETTLMRVIEDVLAVQTDYLCGRESTPRVLTINDVADRLELHPSTVSRAVKDKYIMFRECTFCLKELFTARVSSTVTVGRAAVMKQLRHLVDSEDKHAPLSDEKLKSILQASGLDISRRTVALYREEMEIPCASARKIRS